MITPGNPADVTPAIRTPGALRCVMYQIEGADGRRWGSFASSGLPETVRLPLITQLLLAASSSAYSPRRASASAAINALCASAFCDSGERGLASAPVDLAGVDRKSTRLNSSHSQISYAVFCLKKKR